MESGNFWISGMWIFPLLMILSVLVIFYIIYGKAHFKFIKEFDKNNKRTDSDNEALHGVGNDDIQPEKSEKNNSR